MKTDNPIPNPETFFKNVPLYDIFTYEGKQVFDLAEIIYFSNTFDSYCVGCKREATFKGIAVMPNQFKNWTVLSSMAVSALPLPVLPEGTVNITLSCTRNSHHWQEFIILIKKLTQMENERQITKDTFQKIGQYPSLADIHIPGIKKYAPLLGSQRFRELSKAIGLSAHDVGVGAYVYLRRVFESLIEEAHEEAKRESWWDEEKYHKGRMTDRIKMLKDWLPTFLIENPKLYSLLSKGVHELSEEECLKHFSTLKICIELILDERMEKEEKERKIIEAKKALNQALMHS